MTNLERFQIACEQAKARSLTHEYKGCVLHVNAIVSFTDRIDGTMMTVKEPRITGYTLSDWTDGSTVVTYLNGERRD